ncbi:MAG: 50S ribosomal protein L21 [Bacteroidetes bacterium]|nr:50S ribosomal protein L21 [Rhodothermia bacterium]MCS7155112.1 50S ribosomal protein L21 [Bacteroidota bacterium]MCX7907218.1 50S ribosomal protein L21 [Bacteroidota bacterium]MDW8138711.1 50S ribosomal protein L21 [Bacteroidota bacterium]MDW8286046.1 50S ribosomal protein L21 [Bacteroidota bacterium]
MYALVDIQGHQVRVEPKARLLVPRLKLEPGAEVSFDRVLLIADDSGQVRVGTPHVEGASVRARVLGEVRDRKVIVFKKRRREGYRVKRGHRQRYTEIEITSLEA